MCGIVGWINFNGEDIDRHTLIRMRDILVHRGPDHGGIFIDGPIGLAHRRLSIIDLSPAAHQPMSNEDETIWIITNGEVYNYVELTEELLKKGHVFKSKSDAEVIVHGYEEKGINYLHYLNGMFAFALYDRNSNTVFLVRDRVGVKPLYYYVNKNRFLFASEIKALLMHDEIEAETNYEAVHDYLSFEYTLDDGTLFKNIKKLLPGHYIKIGIKGYETKLYWDIDLGTISEKTECESVEQLRKLIFDSVALRLRSDVPVGCYLSGGLDSSLVSAVASQLNKTTLSSFTGRFLEQGNCDEGKYAQIQAYSSQLDYNEIIPDGAKLPDVLPKIIWHLDEPVVGPGIFPQYEVAKLAAKKVKVILGGQGGDELFAGYHRYVRCLLEQTIVDNYRIKNFNSFRPIKNILCKLSPREITIFFGSRFLEDLPSRYWLLVRQLNRNYSYFSPDFINSEKTAMQREKFQALFNSTNSSLDSLNQLLYFDVKNYLPALLQVEDRINMALSIEARLPLLDYRIVEAVFRISGDQKIGVNFERKHLLKKVAKGIVSETILNRRDKMGFNTPFSSWIDGKLKDYIYDHLTSECFFSLGLIGRRNTEKILNRSKQNSELIWNLLNLSIWSHTFLCGKGVS
jgi:asparagine synthase (glutamine-hydrolysing)